MKNLTLLALGLITFQSAFAASVVTSWTNPDCATGQCEVKGLKLFVDKLVDRTFTGNMVSVELETSSRDLLTKYGIVQYIKGCQYSLTSKGEVKMSYRSLLGKNNVPFLHKDWEVDSADDNDPVFWSNPAAGYDDLRGFEVPRNSSYAYANPAITESYGPWGGKPSNLKESKIFVSDQPSPATWKLNPDLTQVVNVTSLQFKTCIYEMSKVPNEIADAKINFPDPVKCLEWSSNFSYDFAKRKFVEQKEISSVCR
jgi:hypothetical protein